RSTNSRSTVSPPNASCSATGTSRARSCGWTVAPSDWIGWPRTDGVTMQLIGMLDSPYVRRAAISLRMLGIPFEHRSLSVFRDFDAFHEVNPLVKAPTLVCDDGCVLVDSSLIIDYAEALAGRSLMPSEPGARRHALWLTGLALVVCEKAVQHFYEHKRAADRQDASWLQRVDGQLRDACALLDEALGIAPTDRWLCSAMPTQADISV